MTAVCRGGEKIRQSDIVSFRAGVLVTAPLLTHKQYLLQSVFCGILTVVFPLLSFCVLVFNV
jgi:hypothetical protein